MAKFHKDGSVEFTIDELTAGRTPVTTTVNITCVRCDGQGRISWPTVRRFRCPTCRGTGTQKMTVTDWVLPD